MDWRYLAIGIVVGCLVFWLIDALFCRRRRLAAEKLLKDQLEACHQEVAGLQAQMVSLQAEQLQTRSAAVNIPLEEDAAESATTTELRGQLEAAKAEIEDLKKQAAKVKDVETRLEHANAELTKLRGQAFTLERTQKELAACQTRTADLEMEIVRLTAALASGPAAAQRALEGSDAVALGAPAAPGEPDDLTLIEGIGPKIGALLNANGITTFAQLASASQERLRAILEAGGRRYNLADPGTWPQQAALARDGQWEAFEALLGRLKGGRVV